MPMWLGRRRPANAVIMCENERDLPITFGPHFADSVKQMKYAQGNRRAGALLRAMAKIASGQAAELPGHRERRGKGANNQALLADDGCVVERSYLAQKSPNAHRLFWVRRPVPHMLNIGGHDSKPML